MDTDEFDAAAQAAIEAAAALCAFDMAQLSQGRVTLQVAAVHAELAALKTMTGETSEATGESWLFQINRDANIHAAGRRVAVWLSRHGGGEYRLGHIAADLGVRVKAVRTGCDNLIEWGYVAERQTIRLGAIRLDLLDS